MTSPIPVQPVIMAGGSGNEEHRFLVLDRLRELAAGPGRVLLEPAARNTARYGHQTYDLHERCAGFDKWRMATC